MIVFDHKKLTKYIIGNTLLAVAIAVLPYLTQLNIIQQWISENTLVVIIIIISLIYWCCLITRELLSRLRELSELKDKINDLREQLKKRGGHFHFLLLPDIKNVGSAEGQEIDVDMDESDYFNVTFFIIPVFDKGRYSNIYSGTFVKFVIHVLLRDLEVNKTQVKCINLEVDSISLEKECPPDFEKLLSIDGKVKVNELSRGKPLRCFIPLQVTGDNPMLQVKVRTSEEESVSYLTQVYDSEKIRVKLNA